MEREVGGGIGMGNTCKPLAVSFQCMTNPPQIKKINKDLKRKKNDSNTEQLKYINWGMERDKV